MKHLTICKKNRMNICVKCEGKYFITANKEGVCKVSKGPHEPQYDFSISENVLECEDNRPVSEKTLFVESKGETKNTFKGFENKKYEVPEAYALAKL